MLERLTAGAAARRRRDERSAASPSETFSSLRIRNFRLFFVGQAISQIGNWLTLVAQTLLVLKLTDSGVAVGLLAACQFGPVLLFGAWAGLVADRSDKRKLLIIVQIFAMVQSFVARRRSRSWATRRSSRSTRVALVGGFAMAFDNPARRAFVVEMVPEDDVQQRGQPQQRADDQLARSSARRSPACSSPPSASAGAFVLDGISYIAVIVGLLDDATRPSCAPSPVAERGKGQVRAGPALRAHACPSCGSRS